MPDNKIKFEKKYFSAAKISTDGISTDGIKVNCLITDIKSDACYSVILVAHDKQGDIKCYENTIQRKNATANFKECSYPFFALICDKKHQNFERTKDIFRAFASNLNSTIIKNAGPVGGESYSFHNEKIFKDAHETIIDFFSNEKNIGAAVALIDFDFEFNFSKKEISIEKVHDFLAIVNRLKFADEALKQLEKFENDKDIKALTNYCMKNDNTSFFREGITTFKPILSTIKTNPNAYTDEYLTIFKETIGSFLATLNRKHKEYKEKLEFADNALKELEEFENHFKDDEDKDTVIDSYMPENKGIQYHKEILSKIKAGESCFSDDAEFEAFKASTNILLGTPDEKYRLAKRLKALEDEYKEKLKNSSENSQDTEYEKLCQKIKSSLKIKILNNKYINEINGYLKQIQQIIQIRIQAKINKNQVYINDTLADIKAFKEEKDLAINAMIDRVKPLFPEEDFNEELKKIKGNLNSLNLNSLLEGDTLLKYNSESINKPFIDFKIKYNAKLVNLLRKSDDLKKDLKKVRDQIKNDCGLKRITEKINDHKQKLEGANGFGFNIFTNLIYRKITKEKIELEIEAITALNEIQKYIKSVSYDEAIDTNTLGQKITAFENVFKGKEKEAVYTKRRGFTFFRSNPSPVTSADIAKDAMDLVSTLKKLQKSVDDRLNEESNQSSQQGLPQAAPM